MKRIDNYICLDIDKIIVDEMTSIIDEFYIFSNLTLEEDIELYEKLVAGAKIIRAYYSPAEAACRHGEIGDCYACAAAEQATEVDD